MVIIRVSVMRKLLLSIWVIATALAASESATASETPEPPVAYYRYKIIKSYPHDTRDFTQGLVYRDGFLYEGTGLYGESILTRRELKSGRIIKLGDG